MSTNAALCSFCPECKEKLFIDIKWKNHVPEPIESDSRDSVDV